MRHALLLTFALLLAACAPRAVPQVETVPVDAAGRGPELLSAFFGLDNALPAPANFRLCLGAGGQDGMPLVFSHQLDAASIEAADIEVVSRSGERHTPRCVTLAPAADPGEGRTLLLVGDFDDADLDPPSTVWIVGDLYSEGAPGGVLNFRDQAAAVTLLASGPRLVWAEPVPPERWDLGKLGGPWGTGSGCPRGTLQVVRATWSGGITKPGGAEVDDADREQYRVALSVDDGSQVDAVPFALADLQDGDNNHELCLDQPGVPIEVSFPAGLLVDPNGDLNENTRIGVTQP